MKVSKHFLSKIIKEEIKNALYDEQSPEQKRANANKRINQMRSAAMPDPDDKIVRAMTDLFIKYRNYLTKNPTKNKEVYTNLENELKAIAPNLSGGEMLQMLDGKIDRQLLTFASNLLKRDKRMAAFSDKLDNYEMSISPEEEQSVYQVYNKQDPDPGFMRVPKDDEAYDQEDVRKDRKTLTQS